MTLSLDKQIIMTAIFDTVGSNCSNVTTNGRTAYTSHKHWNKWAQDNITWFWTIQSWIKCQWCSKTLNRVNSAEENVNKLKKWMNIKKEEQNQTWLRNNDNTSENMITKWKIWITKHEIGAWKFQRTWCDDHRKHNKWLFH